MNTFNILFRELTDADLSRGEREGAIRDDSLSYS